MAYLTIQILFQDAHILVINKPHGLLSQPGKSITDSVHSRLQQSYPHVMLVHRLDMSTSGLMVFALSKLAQTSLAKQFQSRQVSKSYQALVFGRVPFDHGSIDLPLRCDWPNRPKQQIHAEGKPSRTQIKRLESYSEFSRVQLTPITGRSHQLRVHMQSIGHPILGDELYAHKKALTMQPRLCLHAQVLGFYHPLHRKRMWFTSTPDF